MHRLPACAHIPSPSYLWHAIGHLSAADSSLGIEAKEVYLQQNKYYLDGKPSNLLVRLYIALL